jgi:DNA-binding beta-propeller fold protein YncE
MVGWGFPVVRSAGAILMLSLAACAGTSGNQAPGPVLYPPPPDTARIQFLMAITSERDLGRSRSLLSQVVGAQDQPRGITKPYGLSVRGDKLYVCDEDILGLDIVDLAKGEISFFQPKDPHGIRRAVNCFADADGTLYVTDTGNKQVMVFDSTGAFVTRFGMEDNGNPVDVVVVGDRIYVSHLSGKKVRVYDRTTRALLFGFPDVPPADSTGLAAPTNLSVAGDRVYVSDLLKQQVFVYSTEGEWLQTIGRPGLGPSTFNRPKGVAVDRDGLVYVVDAAFDNVQVFRADGRLLMYFGGPGEQPGSMVLPAKVVVDYDHLDHFAKYVARGYTLKHLIFVTNQYGPWRIGVYGFIEPATATGTGR